MATTYDIPTQPERKRRRRTRWEQVDLKEHETKNLVSRLDRITQTINTNAIPVENLCRSPSPEPRYDNCGKRVNTRYDRALDKLETERFKLCSRLKVLDPNFRPPRGMRPPRVADKLYLPKEKEGTLNFIGLILGPRGNTQKRLERDYICKVAIRGKGSVKDGRARGPAQPEDNEQLHVIITAEGLDAKERIDKCKKKILDIITPRQDDDNDHKQAQLRELAQLNGTLREQDRDFRQARSSDSAVKCSICGDSSHPTSDCAKKDETDADYASFMAQLHGESEAEVKKPPAPQGQDQSTPPWLAPGAFATRTPPPPPPDSGSTQIGQWYQPFAGNARTGFRHGPGGRPHPYQPGPPGPPGAPHGAPPGIPPGAPPGVPLGAPPGVPLGAPPGVPPGAPLGVPPGAPPGPPPFGHAPPVPVQPYGQGMFPVPPPPPDGLGGPPPPPPPPPPMEDGMPPPPPPPPPLAQDDLPPPPPPPPPG